MLFRRGKTFQDAADAQRFFEQRMIAVFLEAHVFDAGLEAAITMLRGQQRAEQGLRFEGIHARLHHDLMQPVTGQLPALTGFWRIWHR